MKKLFPIQIYPRDDHFVVTTAIEKLASNPDRINVQLSDIASKYSRALSKVRETLENAKRNPRERSQAYWLAGRTLLEFENALVAEGFYLPALNTIFARDLGRAEGTLRRWVSFSRRNPSVDSLDEDSYVKPRQKRHQK